MIIGEDWPGEQLIWMCQIAARRPRIKLSYEQFMARFFGDEKPYARHLFWTAYLSSSMSDDEFFKYYEGK
jgi:hypothetical protein